ncbi:antitermination protein NusB [Paenibacillus albiflavus]|uniref:Antitermination protein NusB n=1 Tax=Paenibacillus albiflavus TaxID=2545760 RepID=A0A4R4EJR0_9BACL|nr:antitermination protein NusB [Paenibacillus albiflavus]TCZ80219.1 antitermination protein NusB [Paenibacillus albiflavus]
MEQGGVFLLFWISLALINAAIAENKNRSRSFWCCLSLLVGPFATLLLVVWEKEPEPRIKPKKKRLY